MLPLLDKTRYGVKAHVKSCRLVVDFPDWDEASNGEIDVHPAVRRAVSDKGEAGGEGELPAAHR